jgi:pimeloyl-ACP methyl ester carboxylesterase
MPRASANGLELEYESFGDSADPHLLLVMGLSYQMIDWDDALCNLIAQRGFRVTRFDNRDSGLSSKFDGLGAPDLMAVMSGTIAPPYTLDDMAADSVGLLDALGTAAAHVVGASMGGMIAQLIAINYPDRVLSLTSMMSNVGGAHVVLAEPAVTAALLVPPAPTRDGRIAAALANRRLINGAGVPFDAALARQKAERAYDRSYCPEGFLRQFAAILAAPDRSAGLGRLTMPTLVIHGEEDPLVPPENGRQMADALPDARLLLIPNMGHNLPERVWPQVADAVALVAGTAPLS